MEEGSIVDQKKSNLKTILFVCCICFVAALTLSILAAILKKPQKEAVTLYKSKQLLLAAKILTFDNTFQVQNADCKYTGANFNANSGRLIISSSPTQALQTDILQLYENRIIPMLTDIDGNLYTFEELQINQNEYFEQNEKMGFAHLQYKLVYFVLPNLPLPSLITIKQNPKEALNLQHENCLQSDLCFVIPINGFGLWDAIYGYLCVANDGNTVIGTTWYDQKETPGLGGDISLPKWQKQFYDKVIFQPDLDGKTNFSNAPLGINVVKSTVTSEVKSKEIAKNSVDGLTGATITTIGVAESYRKSLAPYRSFLIKMHQNYLKSAS